LTFGHIIVDSRKHGPFPLSHGDFHGGNLLFDDEYNLKAVIDWANAFVGPLELLSVCGEFLPISSCSAEESQIIVDFRILVIAFLQLAETEDVREHGTAYASLSSVMRSKGGEIASTHYLACRNHLLDFGKEVAVLAYGRNITWNQLKNLYGHLNPC
jgi:hypothetical protein